MNGFKTTKIIIDEIDRKFLKDPLYHQNLYDEYIEILSKRDRHLNKETILAMYGSKK